MVQFIVFFGKFFNSSKEVIREITMLFTLQNMQWELRNYKAFFHDSF